MANNNKQFVSRELTGEVRSLCLKEIRKVLLGKDGDFKQQVILRLAGQILPRLNEHTGEEGGAIIIQVAKEILDKHELNDNSTSNTIGGGERQA